MTPEGRLMTEPKQEKRGRAKHDVPKDWTEFPDSPVWLDTWTADTAAAAIHVLPVQWYRIETHHHSTRFAERLRKRGLDATANGDYVFVTQHAPKTLVQVLAEAQGEPDEAEVDQIIDQNARGMVPVFMSATPTILTREDIE